MNSVERDREDGRTIFSHITEDVVRERWVRASEGGMLQVKTNLQREAALAAIGELEVEEVIDPRLAQVLEWIVVRTR